MTTQLEQLDDSTLEKFQSMVGRLNVVRNEKIWKNFKLRDAEFLLHDIKDTCPDIFLPMVRFYELEVQCLRWALCPTELLILEVEANCRELSKSLHQISKQLKRISVTTKAGKVFAIEYRLMEAEVLMICAAIDFQKRNFITAAHTMVKSNELFLDLAQVIDEIRGKSDESLQTEGFISLCQQHLHSKSNVSEELLQNLRKVIDEKTADIRRRHSDRHSAVPEEILEATRSLLQLKQLYADLSGKWRSSDGHKETAVKAGPSIEAIQSPRRTKSMTSLVQASSEMPTSHVNTHFTSLKTPRSPDSDDEEDYNAQESDRDAEEGEDADENDIDKENQTQASNAGHSSPPQSPFSTASKTPSPRKLKQKYNLSPYKQHVDDAYVPRSPVRRTEPRCLEAKFAIESPQKISVNTVTSILPKMFTFSNFFSGYGKSQQHASNLKQINQRKPTSTHQQGMKKMSDKQQKRKSSSTSNARANQQTYYHTCEDMYQTMDSEYDRATEDDDDDPASSKDVDIDVVDFQGLFNHTQDDFCEQQLVKALARVHFAVALRNLLFANSPKSLKWMLNILQLVPNVTQSIVTLYQVHNFEDCRWGPFATLILLNMPTSVLDNAMQECDNSNIHQYLPINAWDQLHSLIEAQSMLAPWTSKNPLWLSTIARSSSANICTNSMTRLDFYRRSLASEEDSFSSGSPYGYFSITNTVSKHFLSLGHWTKAYNSARSLFGNPMVKRHVALDSLAVQIASAAAASCSDNFGYQNKYLHLKFSDQIIVNSGSAALLEVAENTGTKASSSSSRSSVSYGHQGTNNTNNTNYQHFHPGISQFLSAFQPNGFALLVDDTASSGAFFGQQKGATTTTTVGASVEVTQAENNLRGRLLFYHQVLDVSESVDPWKDDSEAWLRATGFWLWLMPIEFLYLTSMKESFTQDAQHNQMLQLCDKGAILFADRYLPSHLMSGEDETSGDQSSTRKDVLGPLIKAIILDNVADLDPAMARRALLLIKKVSIVQEQNLFSGQSHLRLDLDERTGIIANSPFENLMFAIQHPHQSLNTSHHPHPSSSTSSNVNHQVASHTSSNGVTTSMFDAKYIETQTALRCVKKIQARLSKIKSKLDHGDETAAQYLLDAPKSTHKVQGDLVVTWLLCRGLILKKLNRIWEAVMMFKLIELCKEMAPRSKFALFAAYTEMAEIVMEYEVCEEPLILAAEYLKRGCVAMRRVFETGYLPYVHEYRRKMQTLVDRLEMMR